MQFLNNLNLPVMKKLFSYLGVGMLLSATMIISSCERSEEKVLPTDPVPILLTEKQQEVVDSANNFAFRLFDPLITEAKGGENILISPFSISSALTMALNGAAGETYDEMLKTLCLDGKTLEEINDAYLKLLSDMVPVDERVIVEIANSLWIEKNFVVKPPFINTLTTCFKAETGYFDVTDPGAKDVINGWIEDKTHDKIKNMIESIDPATVMFLINAVYFNGKWRYQFDADATTNKPFYFSSGSSAAVPTMYNKTNLNVFKCTDATLVELPYGQGNYAMVVLLPDEGKTPADIAAGLDAETWEGWMELLGSNTCEVHLRIPKFKYGYNRSLKYDLKSLGMEAAFTDFADFSNITDDQICISNVIHQSFIETNEEGTEAAAATIVTFITTSNPSLFEVDINRPFLYFIREKSTGTILFMGKVENPTTE